MSYYLPGLSPGPKQSRYSIPGLAAFISGGGTVEHTPFGTPIYIFGTGEVIVGERTRTRVVRVVHRITRYAGLALLLSGIGWAAGYLLPAWTAGTVVGGAAIAGGVRATKMAAEDLARIGIESRLLRIVLAGKVGVAFGAIPLFGGLAGILAKHLPPFQRYVRERTIRAGRRGLTGWGN